MSLSQGCKFGGIASVVRLRVEYLHLLVELPHCFLRASLARPDMLLLRFFRRKRMSSALQSRSFAATFLVSSFFVHLPGVVGRMN